jgi:hypothetical protein
MLAYRFATLGQFQRDLSRMPAAPQGSDILGSKWAVDKIGKLKTGQKATEAPRIGPHAPVSNCRARGGRATKQNLIERGYKE